MGIRRSDILKILNRLCFISVVQHLQVLASTAHIYILVIYQSLIPPSIFSRQQFEFVICNQRLYGPNSNTASCISLNIFQNFSQFQNDLSYFPKQFYPLKLWSGNYNLASRADWLTNGRSEPEAHSTRSSGQSITPKGLSACLLIPLESLGVD